MITAVSCETTEYARLYVIFIALSYHRGCNVCKVNLKINRNKKNV